MQLILYNIFKLSNINLLREAIMMKFVIILITFFYYLNLVLIKVRYPLKINNKGA